VPGSSQGLYLVVPDIDTARDALLSAGADVSEVFHETAVGDRFQRDTHARGDGPAPDHQTYGSFATFSDPDGNGWLLQEIKTRLPGRGFSSDVATLTELLRETEQHHGKYEATAPKHHWSGWYAAYIVARERGKMPEQAAEEAGRHMDSARQ
jgi:hypothetical protein